MKGTSGVKSSEKLVLAVILICSAVLFGTALMAHGGYMHQGKWWQSQKLAQELNLTNDEKQALEALYVKNRDTLIDMKSTLVKDRFMLHDMLEKDTVDETSVLAQNKAVEEDRLKISEAHINYMLNIRKILGPDRYHKFTAGFHEMMERRHGKECYRSWNKEQQ
jgi:Spy/CpxP family protein refolding chaperone